MRPGDTQTMLHLLLDEQISPVVAEQIAARGPDVPILSFHDWESGRHLNAAFKTRPC